LSRPKKKFYKNIHLQKSNYISFFYRKQFCNIFLIKDISIRALSIIFDKEVVRRLILDNADGIV